MQENTPTTGVNITYTKNLILIAVFFLITPIVLAFSSLTFLSLSSSDSGEVKGVETIAVQEVPLSGSRVYASLPSDFPSISGNVISVSSKVGLIEKYLFEKKSPLAPYAELIVGSAEKYGLDYRLITAIAQKESGLCRAIPEGSYNCWGWGIHSQGTLGFNSFQEGIETVSQGLKKNYIDKGFVTIEDIMAKYTPLSSGTWAEGVSFYMNQIIED